ncbi:MAG: hypothetical protein COB96_07375, partial [Planctomycetota bacterium]
MATTTTEDVDIPGRLIRLRDNENGSIYWLGNAPAFNRAWMQRPDDSRRVSTTAGAIADRLGATQAVFIRALVAIWEHATAPDVVAVVGREGGLLVVAAAPHVGIEKQVGVGQQQA